MQKLILGFTGLGATGKSTIASYFSEKYSAGTYRYSAILSDLTNRLYLEGSRDVLIRMSECVRAEFGEDILAKAIAKDAEADSRRLIIVEGIRRMADIEHLSKLPNFVLVEIFADPKKRFERLAARQEKSDDIGKTFEQFLADDQRSTEVSILDVAKHATEHIDNNGTKEQLFAGLDALVKKYQ